MLSSGSRFGSYEVLSPLGAGGMGEVYRARDLKLGREVALKVLPESVSTDDDRLARFEREAQVLASLNHPNIAAIYGVEESGRGRALILELVEGPTLADRLADGPLPLEEALRIARQIADALSAAHDHGIVHRDLKPANIKLRPDGTVKVLDFGLARSMEPPAAAAPMTMSPTITSPAMVTGVGVLLGTAAYMAPEQARGKVVDRRADIFAFGAVLYELITGRKAFAGEDVTETIARVIQSEPPWDDVPIRVRRLLQRCLQKDPNARIRDIADVWDLLETEQAAMPIAGRGSRVPWALAAVAFAMAVVAVWAPWRMTQATDRLMVRLDVDLGPDIALPPPALSRSIAISPDGSRIAYVASVTGNRSRLYTRRLDQSQATELMGTEDARAPMFSPDGQWIAFFTRNTLSKVSVQGGAAIPVIAESGNAGAAWEDQDHLLIGHALTEGLTRVSAAGGVPETLLSLTRNDFVFRQPSPIPGKHAILFSAPSTTTPSSAPNIEVLSLSDGRRKIVVRGGSGPRYVSSGHLLYVTQGTLFATPFDPDELVPRGAAVPVIDGLAARTQYSTADYDVSETGTLVYRPGQVVGGAVSTLAVAALGRSIALPLQGDLYFGPRVSPNDGRLVAFGQEGADRGIWVYDIDRGTKLRIPVSDLTTGPLWTPDGRFLVMGGAGDRIVWTRSDGSTELQTLIQGNRTQAVITPTSFSRDGTLLAFHSVGAGLGAVPRIATMPVRVEGGQLKAGTPSSLAEGTRGVDAAISTDGQWLAYESNDSGRAEVFVQPLHPSTPNSGGKVQISNAGGQHPVWHPDGRQLLYRSGDAIMTVSFSVHNPTFVPDKPRVWLSGVNTSNGPSWDLFPDGKRVVMLVPATTTSSPAGPDHTFVYIQNFFDELRRRAPPR